MVGNCGKFNLEQTFENFTRFKNGHFKCIQLEPPTIVFEDFTLKSMIFENFSTVFDKGLCKGRLGNSLFFMAQNGEFGSIAPCVSVTLLSLKCYIKKQYIKVADLYIAENFQRFLFKHTRLRGYVVLYGENSSRLGLL